MRLGKKLRLFQLGLLSGLVGICSVIPASAATQGTESTTESILLSPTTKRYSLLAGSSQKDSFDILNDGQTKFEFVVYTRPYSVKDTSYTPDFVTSAQNADAYKWVQFDKPTYTVEPGQMVEVGYTLRVPANATPGGHYGVLFAETQPSSSSSGTSIVRKKRVGAILYITVKGDVKTSGSQQSVNTPFFQFDAPLKIRSTISNSGNTDFQAKNNVTVSDIFGNIKYRADKEVTVLPEKPREIVNDWANPAWIGLYKVTQTNQFLDTTKSTSAYVLLVPIWAYLVLVFLLAGRIFYEVAVGQRKK